MVFISETEFNTEQEVTIVYKNHRGETGERRIIPRKLWFGSTEWHKEDQWLLDALDTGKGAMRGFAMKDILSWK